MTAWVSRPVSGRCSRVWGRGSSPRSRPTSGGGSAGRTRRRGEPGWSSSPGCAPWGVSRGSPGAAGPGVAALEGAALVLGHAAPDAGVLTGLDGPLQAGFEDLATAADGLGLLDLSDCRAGVPDGEEQLGILVEAGSAVAPVHEGFSLSRVVLSVRAPAGGWLRTPENASLQPRRTSQAQTSVGPH